jgi:CubicO group peptidase (beta-lactamase class C family)
MRITKRRLVLAALLAGAALPALAQDPAAVPTTPLQPAPGPTTSAPTTTQPNPTTVVPAPAPPAPVASPPPSAQRARPENTPPPVETIPPPAPVPTVLPTGDRQADVDRLFSRYAGPDTPGCAVSAVRDGRLLIQSAYGSADLEHDIAITPATVFEAGSVSKQVTAAAVLLLVRDGRLKLTDNIRKYLPELPDYGRPITIDQLLNHTSGLRDWGDLAAFQGWPRGTRAYNQPDVVDLIRRQQALNYLPGAEYSYTNSGYNLLTEIIRRVSGQTLAEFSKQRMFQPLGMTSTAWRDDFRRIVKGRAIAYARDGAGWEQQMPFESGYGNGGLLTTLADLQTWNAALDADRIGPGVTAQLQKRASLTNGVRIVYARGLVVQTWAGQEEISHSGATGAYRAWIGRYPARKLSIALLCNAADANTVALGRGVAALFLPPPPVPPPGLPLADAASRAGLYVNDRTGRPLVLATSGDGLKVAGGDPLYPIGADRAHLGADEIIFQGRTGFVLKTFDGNSYAHHRVAAWTPNAEALGAFVGRYRNEELAVTYRVFLENGALKLLLENRPQIVTPMGPLYQDAFNLSGNLARFRRDPKGQVVTLSLGSGRVRDLRLTRLNPLSLPPAGPRPAPSAVSRPPGKPAPAPVHR